ncbi:MAG: acetamidase/formamidase family protein [Solirubrobacteraceae bacterium]
MEHTIDPALIHHDWDRRLAPALRVASGDTVAFELAMTARGQLREGDSFADARFDFDTNYNLAGPIHVEGAAPGDTLRVDVLALEPGDWGWAVIAPGEGLLADRFTEGYLRTFDLRDRHSAELVDGVRIPLAPFLGTMGTHPGEPEVAPVLPPHRGGGNIDNRHLTVGSTLWLPVWCEGALFSCGDAHAMQGDGEVCVTAIECDMRATLRLSLERRTISAPQFRAPGPLAAATGAGEHHGTMGIAGELMEGARIATGAMIDWLVAERGLDERDAYILCSLAGDLKLLEVVDGGMWNVGMTLPLSVLG